MCVWNTNHVKSDGEIATKLGTWTKFDFVKNMGCFVSSVVSGIWEGKATKIFHGNVYRVEPPSGGSWTTRIIDVMLENLMCCREILCCWNERIQENLIQLSCQTITLWFPRQEARWQCSHQIEFVMTETRHTWISINIRMFLIWGLWRRALFQSWINWWSSNRWRREEMGAQRGAEIDEGAELPIRIPQVDMAEKPRSRGITRSTYKARPEGGIVVTSCSRQTTPREENAKERQRFCQIVIIW